jgi:hypothetical protein
MCMIVICQIVRRCLTASIQQIYVLWGFMLLSNLMFLCSHYVICCFH